jgi:endonuclease-3 related protein
MAAIFRGTMPPASGPLQSACAGAASRADEPSPHIVELFYNALNDALGPQHWWPARTRFEVIAGAILTQNTAWGNVEKAIRALAGEGMLEARKLERVALRRLERLVRPSGYFRQKARKLKAFARFLNGEFGSSLDRMFRTPTAALREKLLGVHGIGPETADSILLYAGGHPVFVIDAYTRRILARHGLLETRKGRDGEGGFATRRDTGGRDGKGGLRPKVRDRSYEQAQAMFEQNLPRDASLFNQYHALLVETGKRWCLAGEARCSECPLGRFLERQP